MFYLDVPFMCIYALVSIINNTIQYNTNTKIYDLHPPFVLVEMLAGF